MKANINQGEFAASVNLPVPKNTFERPKQKAENYKTFLLTIAINLGLSEKESHVLVEYVCLAGERNYVYQEKNFPLKLWLSKILVHNCVVKISSVMFSKSGSGFVSFQGSDNYLGSSSISKIPFSFRTVYILFYSVGFEESEVAYILNITPMQVRERLARALMIIKQQQF